MNIKDKAIISGVIRDITHDLKEYISFTNHLGGLTLDGLEDRLKNNMKNLQDALESNYENYFDVIKEFKKEQ